MGVDMSITSFRSEGVDSMSVIAASVDLYNRQQEFYGNKVM
jgi:hypothetical protein